MKKIALVLITAIYAYTPAYATNFDGYYGSLALGWTQGDFDVNGNYQEQVISTSIATGVTNISDSLTKSAASGGIALGVENSIKQYYLFGLEARANFDNVEASSNRAILSTTTLPGSTTIADESVTMQVKEKINFNLLIRLGVIVEPNLLIYTIIGPTYGYFEELATINNTGESGFTLNFSDMESGYDLGWMGGIGLDYMISKNMSLALEYTHSDYGKLNSLEGMAAKNIIATTYQASLNADVDAKLNEVSLRASYHFG